MSKNKKTDKIIKVEFSSAMDSIYDSKAISIKDFSKSMYAKNQNLFWNFSFRFNLENGMAGFAQLGFIADKRPFFLINVSKCKGPIYLHWYEFEIIRPFIANSVSDFVERYHSLLDLYKGYLNREYTHHSSDYFLRFLKHLLPVYQQAIEDIAVSLDGTKQFAKQIVEESIRLDLLNAVHHIKEERKVMDGLVENLLLN